MLNVLLISITSYVELSLVKLSACISRGYLVSFIHFLFRFQFDEISRDVNVLG